MDAVFYWFAWVSVIIVTFFIQKQTLRQTLLLFSLICMCTYASPVLSEGHLLLLHISLLVCFGIRLWVRRSRSFVQHFWPFVLSVGYSAGLMFFIIHPVWSSFPGISFGIVFILLLLRMTIRDIEGLIGTWMVVNALGALFTYGVFYTYANEKLVESQAMLVLVFKGLLVLFILYGINNLKQSNKKTRKSKAKGAVFV
ncbi:hypothetical protein [Halobacillus litoralis]|uniref:YphA family membrane protein n=1 Tax=Halobacillus litoralis TaxID=45668 RepID=UPI001CFD6CF8|nr:hypothetical protein [Halobacillus litoralis]